MNGLIYFGGQIYSRTHACTHTHCRDDTAYPS